MVSCFGTADGHSIYVKGLPLNASITLLENEFKKFGLIKNNGIQVRSQKVCFISQLDISLLFTVDRFLN